MPRHDDPLAGGPALAYSARDATHPGWPLQLEETDMVARKGTKKPAAKRQAPKAKSTKKSK